MRDLSDWLFEIGFFPILHEAVKIDFLSWYYVASQSDEFVKEVDFDNSELTELALEAQNEAENFDQNNPFVELIEAFEDLKSKIDTYIIYVAAISILVGSGASGVAVFQLKDFIYSWFVGTVGGIFLVGGVGIYISYNIIAHQMKTNSELIMKFNKELVEKPGDMRRSDQDWNQIAAQFFWNKSLLSPTTHICLVVLSLIRVLSVRLYGRISADLQQEVKGFVGMSTVEIVKHQLQRLRTGDVPSYSDYS
jgi:hypothetical protein